MHFPNLSSILGTLDIIEAGNYAETESLLKTKLAPCISCVFEQSSSARTLGSRVGGAAHLPEDIQHPCDRSGKPMLFVAQINFAELPTENINCAKHGLFMLFCNSARDFSNPKDKHAFRCIWIAEPEEKNFVVSAQPKSIAFQKRLLRSESAWSLAEHDSAWSDSNSLSKECQETITKLLRKERIIQLFGHAGKNFDTMQEIAAFAGNGISWSPARRNDSCFSHLLENAKDWKLLMQINSMPDLGLDLKSLSMYLLIRQVDLELQNYDKAWLLLS